jgi:hypothetical protein
MTDALGERSSTGPGKPDVAATPQAGAALARIAENARSTGERLAVKAFLAG